MHYLEAMGIDSYIPRFLLPLAKAPTACQVPREATTEQPAPQANPAIKTPPAPPSVPESVSSTAEKQRETVAADIPDSSPLQTREASFSLALWHVGGVQIIDSHRSGEALPTHALLTAILQSVALLDGPLPKVEVLNWPMTPREHNTSWLAAMQMVQGFLEARFAQRMTKGILLMGEDACHAVLDPEFDLRQHHFESHSLAAFSTQALILPSLSDLLYESRLKAPTWRAMVGFLKHISA